MNEHSLHTFSDTTQKWGGLFFMVAMKTVEKQRVIVYIDGVESYKMDNETSPEQMLKRI